MGKVLESVSQLSQVSSEVGNFYNAETATCNLPIVQSLECLPAIATRQNFDVSIVPFNEEVAN